MVNGKVKVEAVLFVDEESLKEAFSNCGANSKYEFEGAFATEMGWVAESGITLDTFKVIK